MDTGNAHVLGYLRVSDDERLLVFANFSEHPQEVGANQLRLYGLSYEFQDLLADEAIRLQDLHLEPYAFMCLKG